MGRGHCSGTNTYLYSARPLMQRMTWGAGKDHGTAMPQTTAPAGAAGGAVDEDEKTSAAVAAKELLGHGAKGWNWKSGYILVRRLSPNPTRRCSTGTPTF